MHALTRLRRSNFLRQWSLRIQNFPGGYTPGPPFVLSYLTMYARLYSATRPFKLRFVHGRHLLYRKSLARYLSSMLGRSTFSRLNPSPRFSPYIPAQCVHIPVFNCVPCWVCLFSADSGPVIRLGLGLVLVTSVSNLYWSTFGNNLFLQQPMSKRLPTISMPEMRKCTLCTSQSSKFSRGLYPRTPIHTELLRYTR